MRDLTAFFNPKSVCLIGASRSPEKLGAIVLKNITVSGFGGKIYLVNPQADTINDTKCYPDVKSLPEIPDLAVMAVPGQVVLQLLPEIGEKGIKNIVVFAAGFKETGPEGAKLEQELVEISQKYGLNILGPNCFGFVNNLAPINVTFGQPLTASGNLRFISQSGAIASSVFDWCRSTNLGFSEFITLGNKAVINENDILEYFQSHPPKELPAGEKEGLSQTAPIGLYLESISNGAEFLSTAEKITKTNPIFIIKPGKTSAAAKAMQSHTGAIAGEDAVLGAALNQAGVIRAQTLEDFFDYSKAFSWENPPEGPRTAIISNAGGPAVISADAVIEEGLKLAELDEKTKQNLSEFLPRSASLLNPVDVLGDALADQYCQAAEVILQNDQVHSVVAILTPQIMTQINKTAQSLGALSRKYQKPILCSFIGGTQIFAGEQILNHYKIPAFRFPERAIASLGAMWRFKKQQEAIPLSIPAGEPDIPLAEEKIQAILSKAESAGQKTLDNLEANELLAAAGIAAPPTGLVSNPEEAKAFCQQNGWPVVLKFSSPGLLHKKDVGGVITDITDSQQLENAWEKLGQKTAQLDDEIRTKVRIQIQKEVLNGVETIIGVKKDPTFGAVLLFGAGGSFAELIADRNLYLLPINTAQAKKLVEGSKIFTVLKGYGIEAPYALDKLYQTIVRLGKLAQSLPEVSDIEINPLIITLNDVWAVDGKVILTQNRPSVNTPKFQSAAALTCTNLAAKFHYFEFEVSSPFTYLPGQYISVKVAPNRINCYSIVTHEGTNKFSLLVDTSPGGPGSMFFENLKTGDKISFLGPFGNFTLKTGDQTQHLLFLGTGCGIAPLRSQIEAALKQLALPVTLYFSLSSSEDVFWQDYLEGLAQKYPNFNYKITVDAPGENWQGEVGYLTELIKKDIPDASGYTAYLCGSKTMAAEAAALLLERGLPRERIYSERI